MIKEDTFRGRLNHLFDTDPRTDSAIADAIGVSKQALSGWRQGTRVPREQTIDAIARMYNVSASWLRYGEQYATLISATGAPPTDLTDEEKLLVTKYRSASEGIRAAVMKLLE